MRKIIENMNAQLKSSQEKFIEYGENLKFHLDQGTQVLILQNA